MLHGRTIQDGSGEPMRAESIPFDVKMKVIRNQLSGFWIFETPAGLLEARLDYKYFITFVGNCVFVEELIDEVFDQLYSDLESWCGLNDKQRDH